MKYSIAGLSLTAILFAGMSACASGPQDGPPGGPDGGPPPARPQIFVSPYGELFVSQPGEAYPVSAWFAGADTDHDGRLTAEEFAADGLRWFAKLDLDGDGVVGPAEIAAYERSVDTVFAGLGGGMGPGGPGGPGRGGGRGAPSGAPSGERQMNLEGGAQDGPPMDGGGGGQRPRQQPYRGGTERLARAGLLSVPQPVRSADRNVDQKITREEWIAAGERWFGLLDQDHDGVLTLETLPKTAMQTGPGEGGRPPRR
jgi:hypothetical protein